ncbi:MAG: hypothetical protein ACI8RA_002194, partial [Chlamydiales bacterium]
MAKVNDLLSKRLKSADGSSKNKMASLAKKSASGNLTSFAGVFSLSDLNEKEKSFLEGLLENHSSTTTNIAKDLATLIAITSEVKAINNQAALLHGERIKQTQVLLTPYRDGAFTGWLKATYGNRQTPYNFLQYYDFWKSMPSNLRPQIEGMPRQAIYSLSSRSGPMEKKKQLVLDYNGETKDELMTLIRENFPLASSDMRKENLGENIIKKLMQVQNTLCSRKFSLSKKQKKTAQDLLQ